MGASQQPVVFYGEGDADPGALAGQAVAVLGYGNLGRSVALNLRDGGLPVTVGNADDGYRQAATGDGFQVRDIAAATAQADVAMLLLPDEVIPACFAAEVAPNLRPGAAVCFASGYALAYGLVEPPATADVLLLAPRMLGAQVRASFLDGRGFVSYLSVERDASGTARSRLLALALAVGALRRGALEVDAAGEALLDLFVEQSVGAWLGTALQLAFQVGVQAGLPAEALVLELYMSGEMAATLQAFADTGFMRSVALHGPTAAYGGFLRTLAIDRAAMQRQFQETLQDIRSGAFAARLQAEQAAGFPTMATIRQLVGGDDPMSAAEGGVRAALGAGPSGRGRTAAAPAATRPAGPPGAGTSGARGAGPVGRG
jgi:ketol-acid reductoisomerase